MVHNIVIGRTWVDAFGPLTIICPKSGMKCVLDFKPCGWFGFGRYEFSGFIVDSGESRVRVCVCVFRGGVLDFKRVQRAHRRQR